MKLSDNNEFIEELYIKHYKELKEMAFLYLKNHIDAQDVVQETFLISKMKEGILRNHPNKIGFLYRTLSFCIKRKFQENTYRTRKKNEESKTETVINKIKLVGLDNASAESLFHEDKYFEENLFEDYKDILSEKEIHLLIHKFEEGLGVKEIAEKLNTSYSNTTTMTSDIYKKIKKFLIKTDI